MSLSRRLFLGGLFAAPAIVQLDNIMPVKAFRRLALTGVESESLDPAGYSGGFLTIDQITEMAGKLLKQFLNKAEIVSALPDTIIPMKLSNGSTQLNVDFYRTLRDRALSPAEFRSRFLVPAMSHLALKMKETNYARLNTAEARMLELELPKSVCEAAIHTGDGVSVRGITAYDINTDAFITRLDVLYQIEKVKPDLGRRKLAVPKGFLPG